MATSIEPFYVELGQRISEMRRLRGMSQEKVATALMPPATRASIANIESGKQRVLAHTLIQLAQVLQVGVSDLLRSDSVVAKVEGAIVVRELRKKLGLPAQQMQRLGRELGLTRAK
jgi:DNA-binding XRE family transcriptional regulator